MRTKTIPLATLTLLAACQGAINVEGSLPAVLAAGKNANITVDGVLRVEAAERVLVIERARMMLGEIEVEGRTEASEFSVGPEVLELGLDGQPTVVAVSDVPAGKYEEIALELTRGAHSSAQGSGDFGGAEPASIIVDGTLDGVAFSFRSAYAPELEFGLGGLDVKDGETATVTVTFDVAGWFLGADGAILDPSDPANHAAIEGNIRASVAAHAEEEDDDDDDDDDDD